MAIVLPKFPRRRSPGRLAEKAQPALNVALCRDDGRYAAGGKLHATWKVTRISSSRLRGVELSVLWHTEGKGDEDLRVHHFCGLDAAELSRLNLSESQVLQCDLPPTPLSYHGRLLSVLWCLRVRLFLDDGTEVVAEQPFHLVADLGADADHQADDEDVLQANPSNDLGLDDQSSAIPPSLTRRPASTLRRVRSRLRSDRRAESS